MGPLNLKNLLTHLNGEIDQINKNWIVINDSHVGQVLSEVGTEENMFLIGLLPNYDTAGQDSDNFRTVAFGQILVLEKTDYSDLNQEQFMDVFQRTFAVTEQIRDLLIEYSAEKQCQFPYLMQLDINSLRMEPIYKLSQCNGWALELEM